MGKNSNKIIQSIYTLHGGQKVYCTEEQAQEANAVMQTIYSKKKKQTHQRVDFLNDSTRWRRIKKSEFRKVKKHLEKEEYKEIFKMHNEGKWSSQKYCCGSHKKLVRENIKEIEQRN